MESEVSRVLADASCAMVIAPDCSTARFVRMTRAGQTLTGFRVYTPKNETVETTGDRSQPLATVIGLHRRGGK